MVESAGKVRCSALGSDLRPGSNRYPWDGAPVLADPRAVYVFLSGGPEDLLLRAAPVFRRRSVRHSYVVYQPRAPLPPPGMPPTCISMTKGYNHTVKGFVVIEVGILNVTGYAGLTAALLVQRHPDFKLVAVSGRAEAGKRLSEVFPFWHGPDLRIEETVPAVDLVFCALPHNAAAGAIAALHAAGSRVVDISADFRLHDACSYEHW